MVWALLLILFLLLILLCFSINTSINLQQSSEKAQNSVNNIEKISQVGTELTTDLNKTVLNVVNEIATLSGFLLPLLKTPTDICNFCQIYSVEHINYFRPTEAAVLLVACQKANELFDCTSMQ